LLREFKLIDEKIQLFISFALQHDAGVKKVNDSQDIGNKGVSMDVVLSHASVPSFGREATPELERRPFDQDLWARLESMEIDPPDATTRFQHRLKQYNKWTDEFAGRVTKEYRRFLYLAARAGHPVTPSDTVDQAWHLHLIYTRHYWQELCGKILGLQLHHDPSAGGTVESNKFERQYEQTIASYKAAFGEAPPPDIWPLREPATLGALGKKFLVAGGTVVGNCAQGGQHGSAHLRRDCRDHRLPLCRDRCAQPRQARRWLRGGGKRWSRCRGRLLRLEWRRWRRWRLRYRRWWWLRRRRLRRLGAMCGTRLVVLFYRHVLFRLPR
jgi:hypothetical protein